MDDKISKNQIVLLNGKNEFCAAKGFAGSLTALKGRSRICATQSHAIVINYDINTQNLVYFQITQQPRHVNSYGTVICSLTFNEIGHYNLTEIINNCWQDTIIKEKNICCISWLFFILTKKYHRDAELVKVGSWHFSQ